MWAVWELGVGCLLEYMKLGGGKKQRVAVSHAFLICEWCRTLAAVGERGCCRWEESLLVHMELSGGKEQRFAIGRAFLKLELDSLT